MRCIWRSRWWMISTGLRKFMRRLPRPYELAADVFQIYRQYKDVLHIVEQAVQAEVDSRKLDLMEVKAKRHWPRKRSSMRRC